MGASGWIYFVPYDRDFGAALARLRTDVFARGEFYKLNDITPTSIAELVELNAESGTHSILDIDRVAPAPATPGPENFSSLPADFATNPDAQAAWFEQSIARHGTARELHPEDVEKLLRTTQPTHAQVERAAPLIRRHRSRGTATIVVVYDDQGEPTELAFVGMSGD